MAKTSPGTGGCEGHPHGLGRRPTAPLKCPPSSLIKESLISHAIPQSTPRPQQLFLPEHKRLDPWGPLKSAVPNAARPCPTDAATRLESLSAGGRRAQLPALRAGRPTLFTSASRGRRQHCRHVPLRTLLEEEQGRVSGWELHVPTAPCLGPGALVAGRAEPRPQEPGAAAGRLCVEASASLSPGVWHQPRQSQAILGCP